MSDAGSLEEAARRLNETVAELRKTINEANEVRGELDSLTKRSQSNTKVIWFMIVGFSVEVVLVAAIMILGFRLDHTVDKLNATVKVQQDEALCPLYAIFLESDTPQNRERAALQGQDLETRDRAYAVIRDSYDALECDGK